MAPLLPARLGRWNACPPSTRGIVSGGLPAAPIWKVSLALEKTHVRGRGAAQRLCAAGRCDPRLLQYRSLLPFLEVWSYAAWKFCFDTFELLSLATLSVKEKLTLQRWKGLSWVFVQVSVWGIRVPSRMWRRPWGCCRRARPGRLAAGVRICGLLSFFVSLGGFVSLARRPRFCLPGVTPWAGGERQGPAVCSRVLWAARAPCAPPLCVGPSCTLSTAPDGALSPGSEPCLAFLCVWNPKAQIVSCSWRRRLFSAFISSFLRVRHRCSFLRWKNWSGQTWLPCTYFLTRNLRSPRPYGFRNCLYFRKPLVLKLIS